MIRSSFFILINLSLFVPLNLPAASAVGASGQSPCDNVGALGADDIANELFFQAPSAADEISWVQIFAVPQKSHQPKSESSKMVYVPPASLDKGNSAIQVRGFYIDPYEVTNAEYGLFIRATGRKAPITWSDGRIPEGKKNEPVVGVTYEDAEAYARWAGKRLPTEAEWEVAAAIAEKSRELSNFKEDGNPSAMTNVAEWTASPYEESVSESKACSSFKTIRRGEAARCDRKIPLIDRAPMLKDDCNDFTGFRCVSDKAL